MTREEILKKIEEIEDYQFDLKMGMWTPTVSEIYGKKTAEKARLLRELEKLP